MTAPIPVEMLPEERETHFSMASDDRSRWVVFTDDPYMIRRLDRITVAVRVCGAGKEYILTSDQVLIRAGKRQLSEEARARMTSRLRQGQKSPVRAGILVGVDTDPVGRDLEGGAQ